MSYNKTGYYLRAAAIQQIAREHYEPGRHDRCYKAVWRKYVNKIYGIGYLPFLRYLKVEIPVQYMPREVIHHKRGMKQ